MQENKGRTQELTFEADKKELFGERSWKLNFENNWRIEETEIEVKVTVLNSVLSAEQTAEKVLEGISHIKNLYNDEVEKYKLIYSGDAPDLFPEIIKGNEIELDEEDLQPIEFTKEQEERIKKAFKWCIEKDLETGTIKLRPLNDEKTIILDKAENIRILIEALKSTLH